LLRRAAPRVRDRLDEDWEVQQRLAAEKRDVRHLPRFTQQKLDAFPRGLLGHELRLLTVLGVDDLVFAVLVTVRAAQVALIGDVQHHRGQWKGLERDDLRRRRDWRRDFADRLYARELGDRVAEVLETAQLVARVRTVGQRPQ